MVGVDYASLGVEKDDSGKSIVHEYLASPSHANDTFYGVQAAQSTFPELPKSFVVIGQSQESRVAWAAGQRQAVDPVQGYLGAFAVSSVAKVLGEPDSILSFLKVSMVLGIAAMFPEFRANDILTSEDAERLDLTRQVGGCSTTGLTLLMDIQILKHD